MHRELIVDSSRRGRARLHSRQFGGEQTFAGEPSVSALPLRNVAARLFLSVNIHEILADGWRVCANPAHKKRHGTPGCGLRWRVEQIQ
jgi:hypothetical protein